MGIDAVAKQAAASVLIQGMGATGAEIAKNIVLSGVKRLTVCDVQTTSWADLSG
jgi:molybdopterin/thiamine biosynthesis adenylyltransferase